MYTLYSIAEHVVYSEPIDPDADLIFFNFIIPTSDFNDYDCTLCSLHGVVD